MLNILAKHRMSAIDSEIRSLVSRDRLDDREIGRLERLDGAYRFWKRFSQGRPKKGVKPVIGRSAVAPVS